MVLKLEVSHSCIYSLIIRQPSIYNAAGCLCCSRTSGSQRQCCCLYCRLPTMQQAPYAAASNNAAIPHCKWLRLQCCTRLPLCCGCQHVAILHCRWLRMRLPTAMLLSSKWLPLCCTDVAVSSSMLQAANRGNTALQVAPSTAMLLPSKWLPLCCTDLLAVKLPAVNCPPNNCQPFCPPKKPCLLTDPALYTAAAWPRLYCRLTGPVQPITARRPVLLPSPSDRCRCTHT
jgi:hypothetical protein